MIHVPVLFCGSNGLSKTYYRFPNGYGAIVTRGHGVSKTEATVLIGFGRADMKRRQPIADPFSETALDEIAARPAIEQKRFYEAPQAAAPAPYDPANPLGHAAVNETSMRAIEANYEYHCKGVPL